MRDIEEKNKKYDEKCDEECDGNGNEEDEKGKKKDNELHDEDNPVLSA